MDKDRSLAWTNVDLDGSLPGRFEEIVRRYPGRLAIKGGDRQYTYAELNQAANRLAWFILEKTGEGQSPVSILLPHGVDYVIAILAILKAGKFCLPLDPSYPIQRVAGMLKDAGCKLLWTDKNNTRLAETIEIPDLIVLRLEEGQASQKDGNPGISISPEDFFILTYTSGSTGGPKGVLQTHRNLLHNTLVVSEFLRFTLDDRFALIAPFTFGASMADVFGGLLNGAAVLPFDVRWEGVHKLADWLDQEQISIYHSVPTIFRKMVLTLEETRRLESIRMIELGGEQVTRRDVELYRQHFHQRCRLLNDLGSTEAYLATGFLMDKDTLLEGPIVPIGYPAQDMVILILDGNGQPLPAGEAGQIAIVSRYLSPGYWMRPELTQAAFRPDPQGGERRMYLTGDLGRFSSQGCLEYLGRLDSMVKIRGQRVETAEVELAILECGLAREAVVTARPDRNGENRLVAYLVPPDGGFLGASQARQRLAEKLPAYMLPPAFILMDKFPQLPFGKIDLHALPDPAETSPDMGPAYEPPVTELQTQLTRLMAEVLKIDRVGIQDDFFDLGGDSLQAGQLGSRLKAVCGVEIPLGTLFERPTAAGLEMFILKAQAGQLESAELDLVLQDLESMSEADARKKLEDPPLL